MSGTRNTLLSFILVTLFFLLLWRLGQVLLPFLVGAAIAYFLDPVADWLEAHGLSRILSVVIITICAFVVVVAIIVGVVPVLVQQTALFIQALPDLVVAFESFLTNQFPDLMADGGAISQQIEAFGKLISSNGQQLLTSVVSSVLGVVNVFVFILIVPVVTFYLLVDWDRMIAIINGLLPREHSITVRMLASRIDDTLSSFVRGQAMVCIILGTFYSIALTLAGLSFGLVIGAIAGVLTFIPYVGAIIGGGLAIGFAFFQFWGEWASIAIVAGIFFAGQFLEGNIITPNLVGSSIGLHPVWLLLAISVFGSLFGFVGMLVAVPVAAVIGVMIRFATDQYRQSELYLGDEPADE